MATSVAVGAADAFIASVYTRHSPECPKRENPRWRRCNCRNWLYLYEDGRRSAKTRSGEQAERLAQAERDARDPVKCKFKEIEVQKEAGEAAKAANAVRFKDALDLWIAGRKIEKIATESAYGRPRGRWRIGLSVKVLSSLRT